MDNMDPLSYATMSVLEDLVYMEVAVNDFTGKMGRWLLEQREKHPTVLVQAVDLGASFVLIVPLSLAEEVQKKFKPTLLEMQKLFGVLFDLASIQQVLSDAREVPSLAHALLKPFSDQNIPIYSILIAGTKVYLFFLPQYHEDTLQVIFR